MDPKLIVETRDGVVTLTINRERRRNALDDETLGLLREAFERCAEDDGVGAIILRGQGMLAFSAGSDIKELAQQNLRQRISHTDIGQALGDSIEQHPCPVIAAIEGYCLGGGLEIAMACDYRIAGIKATLGLPEIRLNALPTWGGTVRLPRLVGVGRAREMIEFGRQLTPDEALAWGLVGRVVPQGEALAAAQAMAAEHVAKTNRHIVAVAKNLITHGLSAPQRTARHLEYLADMSVLASDALEAGVKGFAGRAEPAPKGP